jgi:hypothetical protein
MKNGRGKFRTAVLLVSACLFIMADVLLAMPISQEERPNLKGPVANIGTMLRFDSGNRFYSLDIPVLCFSLVPASEYVQLNARYYMMFGMRRFFFDPMAGIVISVYPFGRILNLHVSYDFSLAVYTLNHYTHIIGGGMDLDFPLSESVNIYAGIDVYTRRVYRIMGYIDNDYYYRSRGGYTMQVGVRFYAGNRIQKEQ